MSGAGRGRGKVPQVTLPVPDRQDRRDDFG